MRLGTILAGLTALGACTPSPAPVDAASVLCAPEHVEPLVLEPSYSWDKPPTVLAPDESVVRALRGSSRAIVVREVETEPTGEDGATRECTRVYAVVLHNFRVTDVISGPLRASTFDIMQASAVAPIDIDAPMLWVNEPFRLLVVRPATYPRVTSSIPVMTARPRNQDHPCFPTTGIAPAPDC